MTAQTQLDFMDDSAAVSGSDQRLVRCISLWQPWASLMACGAKFLETRGWDTKVRGEVWIHAAKTTKGITMMWADDERREAMERALNLGIDDWPHALPLGALVARGRLVRTMPTDTALREFADQEPFGDFGPGRYAHEYVDLSAIEPIRWKGAQGFFFAPNK